MIGYYAHSHGSGHANYAQQLSDCLGEQLIVFTDSSYTFKNSTQLVQLPDEELQCKIVVFEDCSSPSYLHYNPLGVRSIIERSSILLNSVLNRDIRLMLIDVSVEVATLCRVSSVPYAYRKMPGHRNDIPHLEAYRGAVFLFAYYPREFEASDTPPWVVRKTIYLGFISNLSGNVGRLGQNAKDLDSIKEILVIQGRGGNSFDDAKMDKISHQFPEAIIRSVGACNFKCKRSRHFHYGYVPSVRKFVEKADVIIAACGSNVTSELLSVGRKFIAIAEDRPFNEQQYIAQALHVNNLAVPLQGSDFIQAVKQLLHLSPSIQEKFLPVSMEVFCSYLSTYYDRLSSVTMAHQNTQ